MMWNPYEIQMILFWYDGNFYNNLFIMCDSAIS